MTPKTPDAPAPPARAFQGKASFFFWIGLLVISILVFAGIDAAFAPPGPNGNTDWTWIVM